jgi:hypothetical protein
VGVDAPHETQGTDTRVLDPGDFLEFDPFFPAEHICNARLGFRVFRV